MAEEKVDGFKLSFRQARYGGGELCVARRPIWDQAHAHAHVVVHALLEDVSTRTVPARATYPT